MKTIQMKFSQTNQTAFHDKKERKGFHFVRAMAGLLLFSLLLFTGSFSLPVNAQLPSEIPKEVYPGGMPFGIRFTIDGVLVVGFCDIRTGEDVSCPARDAGLCPGDRIVGCEGVRIGSVGEFTDAINKSNGKNLRLSVIREEKTLSLTLKPKKSDTDGSYKSGIWIRDSGAGIGTVTFILPDSNLFAGLGHGICDSERGSLIPMARGTVLGVRVREVIPGKVGAPGEIKGYFTSEKLGTLLGNTNSGMFGALSGTAFGTGLRPVEVAGKDEVKPGKATIYSTLDEAGVAEYEVELLDIRPNETGGKCFTVHVTDPKLLSKTGGIVQGMSGSPILQNGKIVGAVTHVMINDPTVGYGIFLENMLSAMKDLGGTAE